MSWKMINRILGLASVNQNFRQQLQRDPRATLEAYGFELTSEELEAICSYASLPFLQFCRRLMEDFGQDETIQ
ncbi:Os1348 family NHLP clan protein [Thermogemmatispora tikiterensis]|uniref:Extradiol ring-cleavage dioxygenase LigAB LigA subunit domain-containing protein n=1 Tax=Thermogemmatispora tikiterensis TaxID=1825093 RepID=A0A328V8T1_9CHLR|nr:Os1348 family NHLP clan protein [Thermogemmatispora tikiterensis]RAQ94026.1 hypothetical protein A4R35_00680 [Thermogemmatispora tikiterensis]